MHQADKSHALRMVYGQLVATLFAALALLLLGDVQAWSGLIGGIIATLANAIFECRRPVWCLPAGSAGAAVGFAFS